MAGIGSQAVSSYDTIVMEDIATYRHEITGVTLDALEVKSFTVSAGADKKLELAYYDSTIQDAPKLRTGNLDQAGTQFLPYATANAAQDATNNALFATVNVVIGLKSGDTFTDENDNVYTRAYVIGKLLASQTIDVTFTASGRARVFVTDASEVTNESTANSVTIEDVALVTDATYDVKATASCKMYVWGGAITGTVQNDDTGSISQGLAVSATASE